MYIPYYDGDVEINVKEFIELANELNTGEIVGNGSACWTDKRYLIKVEGGNELTEYILPRIIPNPKTENEELLLEEFVANKESIEKLKSELDSIQEKKGDEYQNILGELAKALKRRTVLNYNLAKFSKRLYQLNLENDGQNITCSLVFGLTIFGYLLVSMGNYDDFFPAAHEDDVFIEILYEKKLSEELIINIINAYRFELSVSQSVRLKPSLHYFPDYGLYDEFHDDSVVIVEGSARLRPLMLGKGLAEPIKLFNAALETTNIEFQILYFTKAIEYVSQTVIHQQSIETIKTKLLRPQALTANADYIKELIILVENQKQYKNDREAIKLTIRRCCDAVELAKYCPEYLKELKKINTMSSEKECEKALSEFGESLYSTRNSLAHAKANYNASGNECPFDEMEDFVRCLSFATQQIIRWYNAQSEDSRIS